MNNDRSQEMQDAYQEGVDFVSNLLKKQSFLQGTTDFGEASPPPNIHPNILFGYNAGVSFVNELSRNFPFCQHDQGSIATTSSTMPQHNITSSGMLMDFNSLKKAITQEIMHMLPPEHVVDEELLELSVEEQAEKYSFTEEQLESMAEALLSSDLQFSMYVLFRNNKENLFAEQSTELTVQAQQASVILGAIGPTTIALLGLAWLAYQGYIKDLRNFRGNRTISDDILERARINAATDEANTKIMSLAHGISEDPMHCIKLSVILTKQEQAQYFTNTGAKLFAEVKDLYQKAYDYPQGIGTGTHFAISAVGKFISAKCNLSWQFEQSFSKDGEEVPYSQKGSSRVDMFLEEPQCKQLYIGEVKTGNAIVTWHEAKKKLDRFTSAEPKHRWFGYIIEMDQLTPNQPAKSIIRNNEIKISL